MNIYILTYKRDRIVTPKYIPKQWQHRTTLVVQEGDDALAGQYPELRRLVLPPTVRNVATTRQYILDYDRETGEDFSGKLLMLDDDLTIAVLKEPGAYHMRDATHEDMEVVLHRVEELLELYPHVGACARQEAHLRYDKVIAECGRAIRFHGINTDWVHSIGARFDRVNTIEDYDFILQILESGTANVIDCQTFVGDLGSNRGGGCSEARAKAEDGQYARLLQSLHPSFVKLVTKETKVAGGKIWCRTDVQVAWKKAYESGRALL